MKKIVFSYITFFALTQVVSAQEKTANPDKYTAHNKGKMFIFWGGNRESFSKSDIHFKGLIMILRYIMFKQPISQKAGTSII